MGCALTADGQIDPQKFALRDADPRVTTEEKKRSRADTKNPEVAPGADAWQQGEVIQLSADKATPTQ